MPASSSPARRRRLGIALALCVASGAHALSPPRVRRGAAVTAAPLGLEGRLPLDRRAPAVEDSVLERLISLSSAPDLAPPDNGVTGGPDPSVPHLLDVLRDDYPFLFEREPELSIYKDDIIVVDPQGVKFEGKSNYARVWEGLRTLRTYSMDHAGLRYSMLYCKASHSIRVFWSVDVVLKPFIALYMGAGSEQDPIKVDGISVYHIDKQTGLIAKHSVENLNYNTQFTLSADAFAVDLQAWALGVQRKHKRAWHTGHAAAFRDVRDLSSQLFQKRRDD